MRSHRHSRLLLASLIALIAVLLGLASADASHLTEPSIAGQRAVVVDTLADPFYGEEIFAKAQGTKDLQGSIAKIMTVHVALWAVNQGFVSLNDEVTISPKAEGQPCTCMPPGSNGQGVQVGEIFTLEGLLYGVLIQSAGEPTNAVAEYVAAKVYGNPVPTATTPPFESELNMNLFLGLMNDHVSELGLLVTRFVTVHGDDDCDFEITGCDPDCHPGDCQVLPFVLVPECPFQTVCDGGTTPRDLVRIWRHAVEEHPFFLTAAGARNITIFSAINNQLQSYTLSQTLSGGFRVPGGVADKGGNSVGSGNNLITHSHRVGRTLIGVVMQAGAFPAQVGQEFVDMRDLLDYSYAKLLHPELRGSSDPWGFVEDHTLECLSETRAVSAIATPDKMLELVTWKIDVGAGQVEELVGREPPGRLPLLPTPPSAQGAGNFASAFAPREVDIADMGEGIVVVAVRRGTGVDLMTWGVAQGGPPFIINEGVPAGVGTSVRIERITDGVLVSAIRNPQGLLVLKTWAVSADGQTIEHVDTGDKMPKAEEFDLSAQHWFLGGQVLTARRHPDGNLRLDSWVVDVQDPAGAIEYHETQDLGVPATKIRLSPVRAFDKPDALYGIAYRTNGGFLKVRFWSVNMSGDLTSSGDTASVGEAVPVSSDILVAPMREGGLLTATNSGAHINLSVWDVNRDNPLDSPPPGVNPPYDVGLRVVNDDSHLSGHLLGLCRVPGDDAEADVLLAHEGFFEPSLRIDAWRSGERP